MSDSCHINPLQQFNNKQQPIFNSRINHAHSSANQQAMQRSAGNMSVEEKFLDSNIEMSNVHADSSFGQHPSHSLSSMKPLLANEPAVNTTRGENWINQFATMQMKDPLEFSDSYKRLYAQYSQNNISVAMTQPLARPQISRNVESHMSSLQMKNSPLSVNSAPANSTTESINLNQLDSYFDLQFQAVEEELDQIPCLNQEQQQFQKAAQGILDTLSPKSIEIDTMSAGNSMSFSSDEEHLLRDKLNNSKFMGLMTRVSGGVVTINENNKELYTPKDNKLEGNEYFPIT